MRPFPLLPAAALAACTPQSASNMTAVDANTHLVDETVNTAPAPPAPGEPGGLDNDTTPVSEAPFTPDSAQGAANVVQTFYALIEAGKYAEAWRLHDTATEGQNEQSFAAGFAKYSEVHATIGAPGAIDAGAGQRYVTVPVQMYGRLKDGGKPFNLRGSVILHRTDVDGATAEQRAWRVRSVDLKPSPGDEAAALPSEIDNRSVARYRCMDGSKLAAAFDPDNRRVTISRAGRQLAVLQQTKTASGIAYAGGGYSFGGKGDAMSFTAPNMPPLACTAIR
jgi:membrane-bound inhibitor of C-type lysozyme